MAKTNFENLQIYELSETLADQLWKIVARWDMLAKDTVGKQLVRAGDNIAEGSGRGTDPEIRRFLSVARGSLYETSIGCGELTEENYLTRNKLASFFH